MDMNLAPIVLFVYNRPLHTLRTLNALKDNHLSTESELYIYADGPKTNANAEQLKAIEEVRAIIHKQKWCGTVTFIESDSNKGLALSVKTGVTEVLEKYGRVIVMEDDLETSPAFLTYMNKALDFYKDMPAVFSISGYNYPSERMQIPVDYHYDTYISLRNASWGWATWKDRWQKIDWSVSSYSLIKNNVHIKQALNRMGDDEFELLEGQQTGKLNIWSIQFTVAHFVHHAVAIYPIHSYVNNIGNDGSGQNCGVTSTLTNHSLSLNTSPTFVDVLYEDKRIINAFYNVFCRKKRPMWQKIINRLFRILGKKSPFVLKGKIYK